jgi:kynurenine formamidase
MPPIITRGLVFDVCEFLGGPVADDYGVTAGDLSRMAEGIPDIESGDALLLRTGWGVARSRPNDRELVHPGLEDSAIDWISQRDFSLVGADTMAVERLPSPSQAMSPLHVRLLRDLGIPMVELLDLEALVRDGVKEVCLIITPLRIQGGTGSPVNPVAIA